jgi:hypothetical protein
MRAGYHLHVGREPCDSTARHAPLCTAGEDLHLALQNPGSSSGRLAAQRAHARILDARGCAGMRLSAHLWMSARERVLAAAPQWARGRQPHIAYLNLLPGTQKSRMPYSKVPGIRKCPKMGGPGPQRWIRALGEETGNPILSTFEYEMFAIWYRPFPFFASLRGCRLSLTR